MFRWHMGATGEEQRLKEGVRAASTQDFLSAHSGVLWQLTLVGQQLENRVWTRKVIAPGPFPSARVWRRGKEMWLQGTFPLRSKPAQNADHLSFVLLWFCSWWLWKVDKFYSLWWTNNKNAIHFWVPFRGFVSSLPWPRFLLMNVWDYQSNWTDEASFMDGIIGLMSSSYKTRNPGLHFYYNKENVTFSET